MERPWSRLGRELKSHGIEFEAPEAGRLRIPAHPENRQRIFLMAIARELFRQKLRPGRDLTVIRNAHVEAIRLLAKTIPGGEALKVSVQIGHRGGHDVIHVEECGRK